MKAFLPFFMMCVAGLLALDRSPAPQPEVASFESPQVTAAFECANPLCDCQSCDCLNCTCMPLEVGRPPDLVSLAGGQVTSLKAEPPPGLIVPVKHDPVPQPAKKQSTPVAAGHWETVSAGFRGRRSYQRWVPAAAAMVCTNGSCAPAAAGVGFGGDCSSGRCRSCR